jgi:hypothetical protein
MTPNLSSSSLVSSSPQLVGCAAQPFPEVPTLAIAEQAAPEGKCRASKKSLRTTNPIRAIVDPIVANGIPSGEERGDGKDHISLAVRDLVQSCSTYLLVAL